MKHLVAAASLIALVAIAGCQPNAPETAVRPPASPTAGQVSQPVGDFQLADVNGKAIKKSDYAGKILVVDFWATWCTACTEKLVKYQPMWDKYRKQGVEFLVVSSDDAPKTVKGWLKTEHPELKMAFVMKSEVTNTAFWGEAKQSYSIPVAKIIDRKGVMRYDLGPDSKPAEVERAITTLLAEKP